MTIDEAIKHAEEVAEKMTIEGALSELNNLLSADDIPIYYKQGIKKVIETIQMEHDQCEDCIIREEAIKPFMVYATEEWTSADVVKYLKSLPPVTPAEKVGHWVFVKGYEGLLYECTVCRNKNTHTTVRWNYCPHCGAKMEEVEE